LRRCEVHRTPRVALIEGLFDLSAATRSESRWMVHLAPPADWKIGVIVGPSGAGKTTILREFFGSPLSFNWSRSRCVADEFSESMSLQDLTDVLSAVGFSSPPSWLRPFRVLSTGEQFRVFLARSIVESSAERPIVLDEFTSVVDRTVARIASAAVQKFIRRNNRQLIVASCHYDILDWLEPDWVYEPHVDRFTAGRSLRRPKINLDVQRVGSEAWRLFRAHHYLTAELATASTCFVAFWGETPVAFASVLNWPISSRHLRPRMREHRLVCLPDFQGIGIGNALSEFVGSMVRAMGRRYYSITSHPAMIGHRGRSSIWRMTHAPSQLSPAMIGRTGFRSTRTRPMSSIARRTVGRFRATFEFVGKPMDREQAEKIWAGDLIPQTPL